MVGLIIKDGLGKSEYRFEHENKPQLLNEGGHPISLMRISDTI